MRPRLVPRASPLAPTNSVENAPGAPPAPIAADRSTPCSIRGVAVVVLNGVVKALYVTYTRDPSGAIAGAVYSARSPGADTVCGADQVWPRSVENDSRDTSWFRPFRPSLHTSTISFVAPAPVGAPLAMSTLGIAIRSFRAPAGPSLLQRRATGSKKKQEVFICMKSTGRPQVSPPVVDFTRVCAPLRSVVVMEGKCVKNAYTPPWLSVRTVHPWWTALTVVGGATRCVFHVWPPSADTATMGNWAKVLPRLRLWKSV